MRNHRFGAAAAGVIATAALAAGAAAAATSAGTATAVPFTAKYAGTAVVRVDGNVADITANGVGKGTPIGAGKVTGKGTGDSSVQPCVPFTGTGALIGAGKTKLTFKVVPGSSGCGDESGQVFSISARATVIKGYGKLANVRGKLKITGVYDRGKGTFTAKFAGTLTK
jgi:hypothetical protein